jgi:NodT family efflux transporter outer membrane factor (OMF) lipoprotein
MIVKNGDRTDRSFARKERLTVKLDRLACATGVGLLLAGCTLGPDFAEPHLFAPETWFASRPPPPPVASRTAAEPVDPTWWQLFNDPVLTELEQQVAASNLDVRLATVRLAESRYQRGIAGASQFPNLNGNASYTREKISDKGVAGLLGGSGGSNLATSSNGLGGTTGGIPTAGISGGTTVPPFDLYQAGFDASWEADLWGRVRRTVESADASVLASAESRRNTLLTSLAELARDYIELRGQQRDLEITRQTLASEQQSLTLTRQRQQGGLTSQLDVSNAGAQVAATAAEIPQREQSIATSINALSLLLGETPGALTTKLATPKPVPPVPPVVPVGLPSELAQRRPDVRQAEAQLHAATADIGAAEADFFPKVTLSGSVGLQSLQFKDLGTWGARQFSAGPSITLPIFEGGQLKYTLDLRKAQQQEAAVTYQQTVLRAFHDVDNALTAYTAEQQRRGQLAKAVEQSRQALDIARQQYTQGLSTFLDVLTAQRTLFSSEQQYADSTTTVSTNLVQLYKALGGGWEGSFPRGTSAEAPPRLF